MAEMSGTKRSRKCIGIVVTVITILVLLLLVVIFRDWITALFWNLWAPIGPGGLPSDAISNWN